MKKIFALLLAIVMVMGLATVASATGATTPPTFNDDNAVDDGYINLLDKASINFTKEYKVLSGTAPAESFAFSAELIKYVNDLKQETTGDALKNIVAPTISIDPAVFDQDISADTSKNATVNITNANECAVGVYTWKITETAGTTAGVNYEAKPVYLVITVLRDEVNAKHNVAVVHYETEDGAKTTQTTNTYEAGTLTIDKVITGNMADQTKEFPVEVVFTPEDGRFFDDYNVTQIQAAGEDCSFAKTENAEGKITSVTVTFSLKNTDSVTFSNIPDGTTYVVKETDLAGYTQTKAEATDTEATVTGDTANGKTVTAVVNHNDTDKVSFENELKTEVDTGIVMDSVPFVVMAVIAVLGLAAFTAKKRVQE